MDEFTITKFPVPPSANRLYAPVSTDSGLTLKKTKSYKTYERDVYGWLTTYGEQVKGVRTLVRSIAPRVLHVDAKFHLCKSDIVCKNGKPKRNDTANLLKALHDVLSSVIVGIDDCYFWSGSFSKEPIENSENGHVTVTFKLRDI